MIEEPFLNVKAETDQETTLIETKPEQKEKIQKETTFKEEKKHEQEINVDKKESNEDLKLACLMNLQPNDVLLNCPRCSYMWEQPKRSDTSPKIWCENCQYVWCSKCNQEWKEGQTQHLECQVPENQINLYEELALINFLFL
jgi:hypothetical protein